MMSVCSISIFFFYLTLKQHHHNDPSLIVEGCAMFEQPRLSLPGGLQTHKEVGWLESPACKCFCLFFFYFISLINHVSGLFEQVSVHRKHLSDIKEVCFRCMKRSPLTMWKHLKSSPLPVKTVSLRFWPAVCGATVTSRLASVAAAAFQ